MSLGILWKSVPSRHCRRPGCGRPLTCLSPCSPPLLSVLAKRCPGSLPLQKACQKVFLHGLSILPAAPSEQNKDLMFMEEALAEGFEGTLSFGMGDSFSSRQ